MPQIFFNVKSLNTLSWLIPILMISLVLIFILLHFLKKRPKNLKNTIENSENLKNNENSIIDSSENSEKFDTLSNFSEIKTEKYPQVTDELISVLIAAISAYSPQNKKIIIRNIISEKSDRPIWYEAGIEQNIGIYK